MINNKRIEIKFVFYLPEHPSPTKLPMNTITIEETIKVGSKA